LKNSALIVFNLSAKTRFAACSAILLIVFSFFLFLNSVPCLGADAPPAKTASADTTNNSTAAKPATDENIVKLPTLTVKASRESGVTSEGPEPIQTYDALQISDSGAFSVQDFLDDLPPGEDGDEVLILIDGEPAHINPASIPLDMIERVQVSLAGSIPELGAYAQGKVINIILKKNFAGAEIGERIRGAFAGGGFQQNTKFSVNITRRKWSYFLAGNITKTSALLADARPLSRDQDHTARGGADMRVAWGSPAVVQAVSGNLNGLLDASGQPVSSALVPENQNGLALTPAQFIPGNTALSTTAYAQRRFNTAAYRMLIAPTTNYDANAAVTYTPSDKLKMSISGNYSTTTAHRIGPPPVSAASTATLVPAAYNPFGQDIEVGLVHTEFGPTHQDSRTTNAQIGLKASGKIGDTTPPPPGGFTTAWNWNTSLGYQRNQTRTDATDLDKDKFTAALSAADPAQRFNPFADPATDPVNANLYPSLTIHRSRLDTSDYARANFSTNGPLVILPGGPLRLSLSGNYTNQQRDREDTNPSANTPASTRQNIDSASYSAALNVPFFGKTNILPLLRRLEAQTSYWQNLQTDDSRRRNYAGGIVWSPLRSLLMRARYSVFENTPATTTLAGSDSLVTQTFIDRARDDETAIDVTVFTRGTINAVTSKNETTSLGFTFEPTTLLRGLRFTATHNIRQRHHIYQSGFNAQEIIDNETSFTGRVIRDTPTADDLALGLPGRITAIDITPGNTGEAEIRDVNLSLEYRIPTQQYGRLLLRAYATRVLDASYQMVPGVPYVFRNDGGNNNPPDWTFQGQASWNFKGWNTVVRVNYTGPRMTAPADGSDNATYTTVNFDLSYQFQKPILGKFGKRLRVGIGIANLFDESPIYADTISGYRGGSPLGRLYTCSFTLPM